MKARELYHSLDFLGKTQQNWAFSHLVGKDYGEVFLDNPEVKGIKEKLLQIKRGHKKGIPLAYLLEESYFYGRRFYVNSDVLIPRPETEGLVERALDLPWKKALDLCTGSGVIATTLYLEKGGHIQGVDLSHKALALAKKNAKELGAQVDFSQGDLFSGLSGKFDLIISNPPYIKTASMMDLEVSLYEPHLALDGGRDGLDLIRRILEEAPSYLNPGGHLLLEIGDEQADKLLCLGQSFCGRIEVDLAKKPRYYIGRKKEIC